MRQDRFLRRQLIRKFLYNKPVSRVITLVRFIEQMISWLIYG